MKATIRSFLRVLLRILFRVRVRGLENAAHQDKLLIIANHESFLDGLLLGLFLPFDPVFVVYGGVTRIWFFRQVLRLADHVAVEPANPMGIKRVLKLVDSGRPVVIFPEGRITVTGSLMKVYEGPAFVAAKSGATLLPVRLDGPARSYFSRASRRYPRRLFPRITLSVLPASTLPMSPEGSTRERRRKSSEAMRRLLQSMLFVTSQPKTLYASLLDAAETFGRRRAIAEDVKQQYSYGKLIKMTLALGRLISRHSAPGECVGILMPNLLATVCMLIGSAAQGRVPAMLNYKAGAGGMRDACTTAGIRTVFTSRAFIEQGKLSEDVSALTGIKLLYLEDLPSSLGLMDKLWLLRGMLFPRSIEIAADPASTAVVLFTSGSEGKPKGVVVPHRALLANIAQISAVVDFSADDRVLNALPIFHAFGLTGGTLLPLFSGMDLFLYPTPLHYRVIPEIAYDRNCSVLFGTSTFLGNYARFAHPYDFYRLRYVIAGAEKLSEAVRNVWFEKFGLRILEGYGATETAPVLAVNTPMAYCSGSVGQLLPGIEARLLPVPGIDQGGVLHVRGPNVMSGYYLHHAPGRLQPTSSSAGSGWYDTGDIVTFNDDGYMFIHGRVKRFAKVAGEMISLETVEKLALHASPASLHAAISLRDDLRGEAIMLFTTDPGLRREALAETASSLGLPGISVARHIRHIPSLPLLGTGKTDYVSLKRMAELA